MQNDHLERTIQYLRAKDGPATEPTEPSLEQIVLEPVPSYEEEPRRNPLESLIGTLNEEEKELDQQESDYKAAKERH